MDGRIVSQEGIPIPTPDGLLGLNITPGDKQQLDAAVKLIKEKTGATPKTTQASDGDEPPGVTSEENDQPADAGKVSKRSLKLDELDELVIEHDGEEIRLSKDELAKGAGLYAKNNKTAEELAKERKALNAERAAFTAKASSELNNLETDIAKTDDRLGQLDEWLEFAYKGNYTSLRLQNGDVVEVTKLEKEQKALELTKRRLERSAEKTKAEWKEASEKFRAEQEALLRKVDANLVERRDELAAYLTTVGLDEEQANQLVHGKAELVLLLDKARRFDAAQNVRPEKKTTQTKQISRATSRASSSPLADPTQAARQALQNAKPGTQAYVNALMDLRRAELKTR